MTRILKPDVLRHLAETWRNCREHYPGWIIAPADARETLWQYTDQWLELLPSSLPQLASDEALRLLAEVIWRLDTALCPMTIQQAETAEAVLARVNPAPSLLSWPHAADLSAPRAGVGSELLDAWVSIAFSILREAREDFDTPRFELWHRRLAEIAVQTPEWRARWHYENALSALFRLDFVSVESALHEWPMQLAQLPFWEVRRASLWAELGDTQRAEGIAETALETIRSRARAGSVDYQTLSEEGWAMRLVMALRHTKVLFMPESERARFQERFSYLARYKCNPWEITEWLELALTGPRPSLPPSQTETMAFDLDTYSTHYAAQESPFKVARPAFAFLRVAEQAGVPLKVGRLAILSGELKNIPLWIAPFGFSLAVSTAIRTTEEQVLEQLLDRTNIAVLNQGQAESLTDWLTQVCERSVKRLVQPTQRGWDRSLPQQILGAVTEALSRLMLRVDRARADRITALAEEICRISDGQLLFGAMKHVDAIFRRGIDWFVEPGQLGSRIINWLRLPLPSEIGAKSEIHDDWAEPFHHFKIRTNVRWERPSDPTIAERIQQLLRAINSGSSADRRRASVRLVVVAHLQGLTKSELRQLKNGLWARLDPITEFPVETGIRLTALLRYCPLPKQRWESIVKDAFLELPFPPIRIPTSDGKGFTLNHVMTAKRVADLDDITFRPWTPIYVRRFTIRWSTEESKILVSRISDWWKTEKPQHSRSSMEKVLWADPVRRIGAQFIDLLGSALIAKLPISASETTLDLLDSMETAGIDTLPARPASVRIGGDPKRLQQNALDHITNAAPESVRVACRAIQIWLELFRFFRWAADPRTIVEAIIWKIAFRKKPGLHTVMGITASLLNHKAIALTGSQIERILFSLNLLLSETDLPQSLAIPLLAQGSNETIPYQERPYARLAAAKLARALYRYFERSKRQIPSVIGRWKEISETSPLPEFRSLWRTNEILDE